MDDHTLVRRGLARLLSDERGILVVGEAADGNEALTLAEQLRPDVVLMDVQMPRLDGIQATRRLLARMPDLKVVILTGFEARERLTEALLSGAAGYVLKDALPETIIASVLAAGGGATVLEPPRDEPITTRQFEILTLVATGLANKQIAVRLGISDKTVRNHLSKTYEKLQLQSRTEAVVYLAKSGLLKL